jgi:hypothetical protein
MVPATAAPLALLTLKLLDEERLSHIDDFNFDEALGLFAGLNVLPKKSFATDYSYRTTRDNQLALLGRWVPALASNLFARRSDDTDAPSGVASIPMPAGSATMLPHLVRR